MSDYALRPRRPAASQGASSRAWLWVVPGRRHVRVRVRGAHKQATAGEMDVPSYLFLLPFSFRRLRTRSLSQNPRRIQASPDQNEKHFIYI